MPDPSTASFATAFHRAARVTRAALYGEQEDLQLPPNLHSDARVPFLGFCGRRYARGGPVLLAINPGGGGEAYASRTTQDAELIPLIEAFVASGPSDLFAAFERMFANYSAQVQTWNLWRILQPTLTACDVTIDLVCYLNLFPYRTANDVRPSALPLRAAWLEIITPLLQALHPSLLIALGKKAGSIAERFHSAPPPLFVVPRTIGDTYVSTEAEHVLAAIRERAT